MELNNYTEIFRQKQSQVEEDKKSNWETIYQIGLSIVNEVNDKSVNQLNELILEQQEQIKMLEKKLPKVKTKVKKVKFDKRIEKKVVNLIITYRKTTKEIKAILLEENKLKLSDRSINEIKKNNNIKGYKINADKKES